jgi:hypothetical protein
MIRIPEFFFAGLAVYWILDNYSNGHINYFAIAVVAVLLFQILIQNRIVGLATGIALGIFSSYMVLAVLSDFLKYEESTSADIKYLLSAGGIFALAVLLAAAMVYKFAVITPKRDKLRLV